MSQIKTKQFRSNLFVMSGNKIIIFITMLDLI